MMRLALLSAPVTLLISNLISTQAGADTLEQQFERLETLLSQQQTRIEAQQIKLNTQATIIDAQHSALQTQLGGLKELRSQVLEKNRGTGRVNPTPVPEPPATAASNLNIEQDTPKPIIAAAAALPQQPVGQKPAEENQAQSTLSTSNLVAVTKKRGGIYFEPTLSFVHSSSNRVAVEGFSIIPSIVVGLINVQETRRDSLSASLNFRYALSDRLEFGIRVPYAYREEDIRGRELFSGTEEASLVSSNGSGLGDTELSVHYKLTPFTAPSPYYTANLRVKTTTGEGPFDVPRGEITADTDGDPNTPDRVVGTFFLEQPTGSGFYSIEPSITVAYPSDPAVLYGSLGYMWNLSQETASPAVKIDPGDAINFGFGMGFAINETTSFNLGYGHSVVLKSHVPNSTDNSNFKRFHVGSLKFGVNVRLDASRSLNVNLSVGVTVDSPDVQLSVGFPFAL